MSLHGSDCSSFFSKQTDHVKNRSMIGWVLIIGGMDWTGLDGLTCNA